MKPSCERCGQPHFKCNGHVTTPDGSVRPCKLQGPSCHKHGGKARQVKAKATERAVESEFRVAFGKLESKPVTNPLEALSQLAGEIVSWKDLLGGKVAELATLTAGSDGLAAIAGGADADRVRAEIVLFERAMDRCTTILTAIARLKIDERLAKIDEAMADRILEALTAALGSAGITGEAATAARAVASRHLRAV